MQIGELNNLKLSIFKVQILRLNATQTTKEQGCSHPFFHSHFSEFSAKVTAFL